MGEAMRRHSRASGKPARSQGPKSSKSKSRNPPKVTSSRSWRSGAETEVAELRRELHEALEQQTATSEVLKVISRSQFDLQLVLDTLIEAAARLCGAKRGVIFRQDGDLYRGTAFYNASPELVEFVKRHPVAPGRQTITARVALERQAVHVADLQEDKEYTYALCDTEPIRTELGVPMFRDNDLVGVFILYKLKVEPFTDKQIELVKNFAAQAVIAIENARLLNELRQRTTDLTEALEQQTATSEVLQVISSSPSDVEPAFAAMLEKAVRICHADFGNIYRWDGDVLHLVATHNTPPAFAEARRHSPFRPTASDPVGRMIAAKTAIHVSDTTGYPLGGIHDSQSLAAIELGGVKTSLSVPMLREGDLIGAFVLSRQQVKPFTEKQIELATNFANQAVIAIENARLLNELRQRTSDLTEAFEQQRATSDLLQVISSSPGNLEPVFQAMLENAVTICGANFGNMFLYENDAFRTVAMHNAPEAYAKARKGGPFHPPPETALGRLAVTKEVMQIADPRASERYANRDPFVVAAVELAGMRTLLEVPMLKEGHLVGAIIIYRQEVRPFGEKQIELVKNFASQVVIAIENSRLLNELRDRSNELERSYALVQQQARQLEAQAKGLEKRVADQVGEIERMGRLRRFLPPQVADLIVASGAEKQLESHRREITALFCDLRGFTGFSEASAPEDVMALLRDYHAAIGELIIKYSGTLERYAGDGVMVVFNDPVPVDNPALRAVQMALETRVAMGALMEKWRELGHEVGFGIGIAHGYATLGTIGFEGRFDYAAIGTVSNVASRLCDEAKPGQILISPRVFTAVKDAVTVEPVGEFTLKGIGRPMAAYNVLAAVSA